MKKRYLKSLAFLIVGLALTFICALLIKLLWVIGFSGLLVLPTLGIFVGIILSLYGSYALIVNKLQLDGQKRKIFKKIFLGSIVLNIGVIILSINLVEWWYYSQIGGLLLGGGFIFFSIIWWMAIGAILIIIGLIQVFTGLKMRREKID